jgi:hypothetical protein
MASHRGIHQKIIPSGMIITAIKVATHSILSSFVASNICYRVSVFPHPSPCGLAAVLRGRFCACGASHRKVDDAAAKERQESAPLIMHIDPRLRGFLSNSAQTIRL